MSRAFSGSSLTERLFTTAPSWVLLVSTGFVGAYTTFSTYEYETQRLLEMGAYTKAVLYVGLSNVIGFGAVWEAVVADFVERRSPGGLKLSVNDGGARPDTVALRLAQAVRLIEEEDR